MTDRTVSAELINFIKTRNVETRAWVAAAEGRWATTLIEDPAWWTEQGIFTVEQFEHSSLVGNYVDFYKSLHGIKPRWINFDHCSIQDLQDMMDDLQREQDDRIAWELEGDRKEREAREATPLTQNPFAGLTL